MSEILTLQDLHARTASYSYLLCVDLEATCDEVLESEAPRKLVVKPEEMEIIEVGMVVLDLRSLTKIDSFQRYVRPTLHPQLTTFCRELTSIQQADVDGAETFARVAEEAASVLFRYPNAAWASWGQYDADQLEADAVRAGCKTAFSTLDHFDVEEIHRKVFARPSMGLKLAVETLGLNWSGCYHRGIDDAENLANVVVHLLADARHPS